MRGKLLAAGLLAGAGILACSAPARAGDTMRLNMTQNTPTRTLVDDGKGAPTVATRHGFGFGGFHHGFGGFGRGFGWGGYRGFGGFGWGGYRGIGWGGFGYRPWGWGYGGWGYGYRPFLGFGLGLGLGYGLGSLYRPYYGYGYGGFGYPYYGIGYSSYGGFGYPYYGLGGFGYSSYYSYPFFGCSYGTTTSAPVVNLNISPGTTVTGPTPLVQPGAGGTYPYDGGPQDPVPLPNAAPAPNKAPVQPAEGRVVSMPRKSSKWVYPAYGEKPRRASDRPDDTYLTSGKLVKKSGR